MKLEAIIAVASSGYDDGLIAVAKELMPNAPRLRQELFRYLEEKFVEVTIQERNLTGHGTDLMVALLDLNLKYYERVVLPGIIDLCGDLGYVVGSLVSRPANIPLKMGGRKEIINLEITRL